MTSRWPKNKIISNEKIATGNVIVGLASFGKASYESAYNSGIGSNGLTSARHDSLNKYYAEYFKESYDPNLSRDVVYLGKNKLTDKYTPQIKNKWIEDIEIGQLLLSPTRTYAPILMELLANHFDKINGLIHCSGGGQTKCLKYLHKPFKIIKDNMFEIQPVFELIKENSGCSNREMYEVFNMGCRLEIYCDLENAKDFISIANAYQIDAQIIGRVEEDVKKSLEIHLSDEVIVY